MHEDEDEEEDHGHGGDAGGDPGPGRAELARARAELARRIRAAFAGAPYPGDAHLVATDRDYDGVRDSFAGRRSGDVTAALVSYQYNALFFMTPAAFRYYLPAYLVAVLRGEAGDMACEFLLSRLVPPRGERDEKYAGLVGALDRGEREAVAAFFAHVRQALRQEDDAGGEDSGGEDGSGPYIYSLPDVDEALRLWRLHAANAA